jgi:hypothetical protein
MSGRWLLCAVLLACGVGLAASASSSSGSGSNAFLTLSLFENAVARGALCNDGTASGMYLQLNASSTDWVIHLQGGYWSVCASALCCCVVLCCVVCCMLYVVSCAKNIH